jgi:hypothetical protein
MFYNHAVYKNAYQMHPHNLIISTTASKEFFSDPKNWNLGDFSFSGRGEVYLLIGRR